MSWTDFSATAYLSGTLNTGMALDGSNAFTLACWYKQPAADWASTSADIAVELSQDRVDENPSGSIRITRAAADRVTVQFFNSAAQAGAADYDFTDGTYDDTWVLVVATYVSNTERNIYIEDSSNTAQSTVDRSATGLDEITIGAGFNGGSSCENALIAEVCIWDIALSTTDVNALQTGAETGPAPNTIQSGNVIGYWPLDSDPGGLTNQGSDSSGDLSENGTVAYNSDHPTITGGIEILVPTGPWR